MGCTCRHPCERGQEGAHSLRGATARWPLNLHPASSWRPVPGPDPGDHDQLPHQLTLPRAGPQGAGGPGGQDAPSPTRAGPAVLEVGPGGRVCWGLRSPTGFEVGAGRTGVVQPQGRGRSLQCLIMFSKTSPTLPRGGTKGSDKGHWLLACWGARNHFFFLNNCSEPRIMMKGRGTQWGKSNGSGFES